MPGLRERRGDRKVLVDADAAYVPAALQIYSARRLPRTSQLQWEARRMNRMLRLTGGPARLRNTALRCVPRSLATRALAARSRFVEDVP